MNVNEWFIEGYNLPKPLSNKETYELFDKVNHGDDKAREKILNYNIRLVLYRVVGRFRAVNYDKKDLVSIGNIGLIKAVDTFDLSKKTAFSSYATRCIDNEILMFLLKLNRESNPVSLSEMIDCECDDDKRELIVEDLICDDINIAEQYENKETYNIISQIIDNLPERSRKIIRLYFGFDNGKICSQDEIATMFNIIQSGVSKLIKRILKQIKVQLDEWNVKYEEKKEDSNIIVKKRVIKKNRI